MQEEGKLSLVTAFHGQHNHQETNSCFLEESHHIQRDAEDHNIGRVCHLKSMQNHKAK